MSLKTEETDPAKWTGQSRLLDALYDKFGGIVACARKIQCTHYELNNWRKRGKVPLDRIGFISRTLNIYPAAFNYLGLKDLLGDSVLTWKETVRSCDLPEYKIQWIMEGKKP